MILDLLHKEGANANEYAPRFIYTVSAEEMTAAGFPVRPTRWQIAGFTVVE